MLKKNPAPLSAGLLGLAALSRSRSCYELIKKMSFVQVTGITHLPRQNLDLQVGIAECQEVRS